MLISNASFTKENFERILLSNKRSPACSSSAAGEARRPASAGAASFGEASAAAQVPRQTADRVRARMHGSLSFLFGGTRTEPENARLPLRHAVATDRRDDSDRRGHGDRSDIDGLPKTTRLPAMATSSLTSIRRIGHAQLHVEVRSVLPSNGLNLTFAFLNASYDSNSSFRTRKFKTSSSLF
jgi:hypothetical protein